MASTIDVGVLGDMWSGFWRSLSESGEVNWTALISLCVGMAAAVLVLIVAGLGYAVQWILVTVGDFGEVLAQVEFLEKA